MLFFSRTYVEKIGLFNVILSRQIGKYVVGNE